MGGQASLRGVKEREEKWEWGWKKEPCWGCMGVVTPGPRFVNRGIDTRTADASLLIRRVYKYYKYERGYIAWLRAGMFRHCTSCKSCVLQLEGLSSKDTAEHSGLECNIGSTAVDSSCVPILSCLSVSCCLPDC